MRESPAFPVLHQSTMNGNTVESVFHDFGLTKRDYFAAHAPDVPHWFLPQSGDAGWRFFEWRKYYADKMQLRLAEEDEIETDPFEDFESGTFEWALAVLKRGYRVYRECWSCGTPSIGMFVPIAGEGAATSYLAATSAERPLLWRPLQDDLFATDWRVAP